MPLIMLLLLGASVWYLFGALVSFVSVVPLLLVACLSAGMDGFNRWKNRGKRRAAEGRRSAFEERVANSIRLHEETFPEANDYDEDGIPYL